MSKQGRFIRFLIAYAVIYALGLLVLPRYFPGLLPGAQKPPAPAEISQRQQSQKQEALTAEQEARTSDTRLSLSERAKKWEEAIRHYQGIERLDSKADTAIDAKIQIARIYQERAATDAKNIGDLNQAESIYKDLERNHPRRTATITVDGKPQQVVVGEFAREKLEAVLLERDQRQKNRFLYRVLDLFVALTGRIPGFSYWFALLLITVLIKAMLHPFTKRQFKYMADMQRIAPKMKEVQEKLKGRPADEINRKIMSLYKEEGVNPAAGCVPMIIQSVALIPLFYMIQMYQYQFREGYFLWIGSALSHEYPRYLATSLAVPDAPLLLLYLVSMFLTSRLQPMAADPQQAQTQKIMAYTMPIFFGYITWIYHWPSAFTFYWLVLNMISTAQQWRILKSTGAHVPPEPPQISAGGGSRGGSNGGGSGSNGRDGSRPVKTGGPRRSGSRKSARR